MKPNRWVARSIRPRKVDRSRKGSGLPFRFGYRWGQRNIDIRLGGRGREGEMQRKNKLYRICRFLPKAQVRSTRGLPLLPFLHKLYKT